MEAIRIENLTTGYNEHRGPKAITRDLNAVLNCGEMVALLGPNGAGKSTLMRTLAGFQPSLAGKVVVLGKEIGSYRSADLAKVISVVLTEKPLLENMTVEALVGLGRTPYTGFFGRLDPSDLKIVEQSIDMVGASALKGRMMSSLSDGERQKVMIAKALAQETPIIFLDEPTAFLDFPSKVEILQLLHSLSQHANKLIFISTHDLELALQVCDKAWLIDRRLGVTSGTYPSLSASGELERYFGRPGLTFDHSSGFFKISPTR